MGMIRQRPRARGTRAHTSANLPWYFNHDLKMIYQSLVLSEDLVSLSYKDICTYLNKRYHMRITRNTAILIGKFFEFKVPSGRIFRARRINVGGVLHTFVVNKSDIEIRMDRNMILSHRKYPHELLPYGDAENQPEETQSGGVKNDSNYYPEEH